MLSSPTKDDARLAQMSRQSLGIQSDIDDLTNDQYGTLITSLYEQRLWEPCTLTDWEVGRSDLGNVNVVGDNNTSYPAVLSWQATRFPEELKQHKRLAAMIWGPGDLVIMDRLHKSRLRLQDALGSKLKYPKGTENRPLRNIWEIYGLGDKVYANLVNVLRCFIPDPPNCDSDGKKQFKELRRYLALFILNQIEGGMTEGTPAAIFFQAVHGNLPGLYEILTSFRDHHPVDQPNAALLAGGRFPRERLAVDFFTPTLPPILKQFLENPRKFIVDHPPELQQILIGSSGSLRNVIIGKFEEKPLPIGSIRLGFDVKSFTHLTDADLEDVFRESVGPALQPGGIQIGDGIRESYSGDHRALQILRAINAQPELHAGVIVERHPDTGELTLVGSVLHNQRPTDKPLPDFGPILAHGRTTVIPIELYLRDHRVIAEAIVAARIKASMQIGDQRNRRMMRLFYGAKGGDIARMKRIVIAHLASTLPPDTLNALRTDPRVRVTPDLFVLGNNRDPDEENPVRTCVKAAHDYINSHLQEFPALI